MKYILTLITVLFSNVAHAEMDELVRVEATMAECDKGVMCACPDSPARELSVVETCGEYTSSKDTVYAKCHNRVFDLNIKIQAYNNNYHKASCHGW
jgi:hypothetical protein